MITLFGHGYIGSYIARELLEQGLKFQWKSHRDPLSSSDLYINAAGYNGCPNVDGCEDHRAETVEGNINWPVRLMDSGVPTIHISSGCLYLGDRAWKEKDPPNFFGSWYSIVKAVEQEVLRLSFDRSWLLRIRMPFGKEDHPRNLITKLKGYPKLLDGYNSISRVEDVAKVVAYFVKYRPAPGIYNVCNPGAVHTREIARMLGLEQPWFAPGEFSGASRSECTLNTAKLQALFPLPEVYEALQRCING